MSNKLDQKKTDAMWAAFLEKQTNCYVSKKCGVSETTVRRYRKLHNWDERFHKIQEETQKKSDDSVAERRARSKKIIRAAVAQIGRKIAEGKMKYSATDLERLVRLDEWLDGLPEKIKPGDLPEKTSEILAEIIRRIEAGEISEKTAGVIGQLSGQLIRAREAEELEDRITALEKKIEFETQRERGRFR